MQTILKEQKKIVKQEDLMEVFRRVAASGKTPKKRLHPHAAYNEQINSRHKNIR